MNWKYKALLQTVFSKIPAGESMNYLFQRYVTRSMPASDSNLMSTLAVAGTHVEVFQQYSNRRIEEADFYEFGAGQDLIVPLALYVCGVNHQILIDIRKLVKEKLVNDTIDRLQKASSHVGFLRRPDRFLNGGPAFFSSLKQYYGIDYQAPCDARATGLNQGAIDCITSTNTLEHIPCEDIQPILFECHRLLRDDGIISFRIDYQDHYSYFDDRISIYNFLQYSDKAWIFYNPDLHYQNRMRHKDFLELFQASGFEVVKECRTDGTANDLKTLEQLRLNKRFELYEPAELAVRNSHTILRKRRIDCNQPSV